MKEKKINTNWGSKTKKLIYDLCNQEIHLESSEVSTDFYP